MTMTKGVVPARRTLRKVLGRRPSKKQVVADISSEAAISKELAEDFLEWLRGMVIACRSRRQAYSTQPFRIPVAESGRYQPIMAVFIPGDGSRFGVGLQMAEERLLDHESGELRFSFTTLGSGSTMCCWINVVTEEMLLRS